MRILILTACLALSATLGQAEDIELFNGKDLTGWTYFLDDKSKKMEDVWSAQDGALICKGKPAGYIHTEKEYENYVLELEWRWPAGSKGGNSGVLVHTTSPNALGVWPKSLECQLGSGDAGDFWVIGTTLHVHNPKKRTMDRRTINLTNGSEKPHGEWNKYVIVCSGDTVTCVVNGDVVNYGWGASQTKGSIALQSEGAEIHFRNIKLHTLAE